MGGGGGAGHMNLKTKARSILNFVRDTKGQRRLEGVPMYE
jgi:hypothetical protein